MTKADTLKYLDKLNLSVKIPKYIIITVSDWNNNKKKVIEKILNEIPSKFLAIRSSTLDEDQNDKSNAGKYESYINIYNDSSTIVEYIEKIIDSYNEFLENVDDQQILIQECIRHVDCSGVAFSFELNKNAPYYQICIDNTEKTDTVTSGTSKDESTTYIFRDTPLEKINDYRILKIVQLIRILEKELNYDIDIEFAFQKGVLVLFQARKLCVNKNKSEIIQKEVGKVIATLTKQINKYWERDLNNYGNGTILSNMTDWNPAEMIGQHPSTLSYSLYEDIITKEIWRTSREQLGYNNPKDSGLMIELFGQPYINVRTDFNSYIPENLPSKLKEKLVNYYLDTLNLDLRLHDKVEFEIVHTCVSFDEAEKFQKMKTYGFTNQELTAIKESIVEITNKMIYNWNVASREMIKKIQELSSENTSNLHVLYNNLKYKGMFPFAYIVRQSFVGLKLLKSLKKENYITEERYNEFISSIPTISKEYKKDFLEAIQDEANRNVFLKKYGFLRSGSYDFRNLKLEEFVDSIFKNTDDVINSEKDLKNSIFYLNIFEKRNINEALKEHKITANLQDFFNFIAESIKLREQFKFEYSKSLSRFLDLIEKNLENKNVQNGYLLTINEIFKFLDGNLSYKEICNIIKRREYESHINNYVMLPDVITPSINLYCISVKKSSANFITNRIVTSAVKRIDPNFKEIPFDELKGKIIFIENADPGFEWLFSCKISGLVTKFGGAASHMAIRCSENGIPAAIGVGEHLYDKLSHKKYLYLNCYEKIIEGE
jgi:CONSERVED HYPOTHTICAL PROTEIN